MRNDFDFTAMLKYNTTEKGGQMTPAKSGYRPQIKFDFEESTTSGRQIFIGTDWVCPGENVKAEITLLFPEIFENKLFEGLEFKFIEGPKLIGTGKILQINNKILIKT
ncbi:hypothetical protein [Kaistella jeonii]|uniref:hypothetical protein n=1 Tax=Kaistella jeonii TaxID=266749 RepID=UPI00068ADA01|nr:hypothetical protein [Kaistella jeonii]SFB85762.1 hypothetical protein SAMN05421876_10369 [Kaistella jeonii]VEI96048.1 Elongation factor Tu [Kaistella jeonii]